MAVGDNEVSTPTLPLVRDLRGARERPSSVRERTPALGNAWSTTPSRSVLEGPLKSDTREGTAPLARYPGVRRFHSVPAFEWDEKVGRNWPTNPSGWRETPKGASIG